MRRAGILKAGLYIIGGFLIGRASYGVVFAGPSPVSPYKKLNIVGRVLSEIENNYVEEVTEEQLIYGSLKGMVGTLDPHSRFLTPDEFRDSKGDTAGEFGGVGLEIKLNADRWPVIDGIIENTPASKAGLAKGDVILSIDNKTTQGQPIESIVQSMRGTKGTAVTIIVQPAKQKESTSVVLVRDIIKIVAVSSQVFPNQIGYIRIKQFQEQTAKQTEKALKELEKNGMKSLILDLRDNPGGLLDQSVEIADLFISSGVLVSTEGKSKKNTETLYAKAKETHEGFPMIVIVNAQSASASEILAGALQDQQRAIVVGQRTFGKGSVQTITELEDGSGLKLTTALYYTPSHRSIQNVGIVPDIMIEETDPNPAEAPQRESDLEGHLKNKNATYNITTNTLQIDDYVLSRAIEHLRAWQVLSSTKKGGN